MAHEKNPDELAKKMLELPFDWWQSKVSAETLLKQFKRHIIPLLVAGYIGNDFKYNVYSGILLDHAHTMVWLTAGHVVDELKQLLSSTFKLTKMIWMDDYNVGEAEGVSLHRKDMPMKSWCNDGLDIGVILPSILDVGNIERNQNVFPITAEIWRNLVQANPEGYFAIGFPRPWSNYSQKPIAYDKIHHSITANLACLPLSISQPPLEFADDPRWSDPEAFFGKILPFTDNPKFEIDDLKGMSGGPILSVERDPDGRIRYRLVGIIQSWAEAQSMIRAEPIKRVSQAIDKWLTEEHPNLLQMTI